MSDGQSQSDVDQSRGRMQVKVKVRCKSKPRSDVGQSQGQMQVNVKVRCRSKRSSFSPYYYDVVSWDPSLDPKVVSDNELTRVSFTPGITRTATRRRDPHAHSQLHGALGPLVSFPYNCLCILFNALQSCNKTRQCLHEKFSGWHLRKVPTVYLK